MSTASITPDQARFLYLIVLPNLKTEHATTKRVIEAVPLDKGDYRPDPVSRTALELAWHMVAAEKRLLGGVCTAAFDFSPINRPQTVRNSAEVAAWFDQTFAATMAQLEKLSGEDLARSVDFRGMFRLPAVSFIQFTLNHTVHHRGQLSSYLRPMGAKVPSIYGESYDAAQERMAKEAKSS